MSNSNHRVSRKTKMSALIAGAMFALIGAMPASATVSNTISAAENGEYSYRPELDEPELEVVASDPGQEDFQIHEDDDAGEDEGGEDAAESEGDEDAAESLDPSPLHERSEQERNMHDGTDQLIDELPDDVPDDTSEENKENVPPAEEGEEGDD